MSCWMQILDLRYPKQIYRTVHAGLTHDLGECKKNIINEDSGDCLLPDGTNPLPEYYLPASSH